MIKTITPTGKNDVPMNRRHGKRYGLISYKEDAISGTSKEICLELLAKAGDDAAGEKIVQIIVLVVVKQRVIVERNISTTLKLIRLKTRMQIL
jgi:hypothetical protein